MQLLKPSWINHDGDKAIFSVDIHPDGSRFATGGQGQDSFGRVVIWNLKPVIYEKAEEDPKTPKLLCQLDQHLGCVNCVRWSHSGHFLASAGDDKVVIIWQLSSYGGGTVFGSNVVNVESWRILSTLRGHEGDILDVAWSPGDIWLATASIDNNIIIWNTSKWPEQVKILRGHTGFVKGIIWDPIGRYLASQADDKSLRIWRTSNWTMEQKITEPFTECGGTTTVLRPSWSPDGQYLVSAHAMNNGGPTAQIVEREGWNTDKDFVGHRKAITCVRFNPNILKKMDPTTSKFVQYCCVAIGSRDKSISIWFTSLKRPLVVIHDIFEDSVLDMSWSSCGKYLMSVSKDGSLAFLNFLTNEIGKPLSKEDTISLHVKLYGSSGLAVANMDSTIIENPDILKLQEQEKSQSLCFNKSMEDKRSLPTSAPTNKQIEMRTADGRRRITPMFIPPPAEGDDETKTYEGSFSSSRQEKSKIVIEKVEGIVQPNVSSPTKASVSPLPEEKIFNNIGGLQLTEIEGVPAGLSARIEVPGSTTLSMEKSAATISVKRKCDESFPPIKKKRGRGRPHEKIETTFAVSNSVQSQQPNEQHVHSHHQQVNPTISSEKTSTPNSTANSSFSPQILPQAFIGKSLQLQIPGSSIDTSSPVITIENDYRVSERFGTTNGNILPALHRIARCEKGALTWAIYLSSKVVASTINGLSIAVACNDASLHIIHISNGSHVLPPIQLHGTPSQLFVQGSSLIALTTNATLAIWDFKKRSRIMLESIHHLVESKSGVKCIHIVEDGDEACPVVVLKTGEAFSWCKDLQSWVQIGESISMRRYINAEYTLLPSCHPHSQHGKLCNILIQSATYSGAPRISSKNYVSSNVKQGLTEGFLRRMLTSAEYMSSPNDYKFWLKRLVKFFINESLEKELRNLFDDLLGPLHIADEISAETFSWQPKIMGHNKRDLLQEFLKEIVLAENSIKLQRLHAEYQEQLSGLSSDYI